MSKDNQEFYTVRGYALLSQEDNTLTPSMEDYLEMCFRLSKDKGFTRISDLASALNVQPPSANNMINKLTDIKYIIYEKYGVIKLTEKGYKSGEYLLKRHDVIENFLKTIGVKEDILEQTEKIEHYISENTLGRIELLLELINENQEILAKFR